MVFQSTEFNTYKNGVIRQLQEKDKTISEKHATLYFEAITMNEQFDYKNKIIAAAETLTKEQVVDLFKKSFSEENRASLSVFVLSKKNEETLPKVPYIDFIQDKKQHKNVMPVF